MALNLVQYDASDSEGDEEESGTCAVIVAPKQDLAVIGEISELPKPSQRELELAELAKKEKANLIRVAARKKYGKVLIAVPSLADLDDEDDDVPKVERKPVGSGEKGRSKLFSKLPPPKTSTAAPVAAQPVKKSTPLIPQSVTKRQVVAARRNSDDEDDETDSSSFFTLDEPSVKILPEHEAPVLPIPAISVPEHRPDEPTEFVPTNSHYNLAGLDYEQPQNEADMELDETALQALQGTKRKLPDDARVIDIRGEKLTYDPNLSQLKQISVERSNHNSEDMQFNKVQKKKHQITYLAAQAKAREVDLKNQWAQNKMSRKQTQAKYGF